MSSPPKCQYLRRISDRILTCPICQETFDGEGQSVNMTQVESESIQAADDSPDTTLSQSAAEATLCQPTVIGESANQPTAADDASSRSSTNDNDDDDDDSDAFFTRVTCCKNIFCRQCIDTWFQIVSTCPMCRAVFIQGHNNNYNANNNIDNNANDNINDINGNDENIDENNANDDANINPNVNNDNPNNNNINTNYSEGNDNMDMNRDEYYEETDYDDGYDSYG